MRDYTKYAFRITFIVVAAMLVLSLVPPFSIGGLHFRRTNILSDIFVFIDRVAERSGELTDADREFLSEAEALAVPEADAQVQPAAAAEHSWDLGGEEEAAGRGATVTGGGLAFEDYTPEGGVSVADFASSLEDASRRRTVRIAFFGDSYIEGDIITGDVREQLQEAYGGQGVGFVPMGTPQAISRPSIRHQFGGWKNYNLIYKKNVPAPWSGLFSASGTVSVPEGGAAWSEYRGTGFRKRLGSWSRARFIFVDYAGATIDMAVNDSITRRFEPAPAAGQLQQISLTGSGMRSLRVAVDASAGDFAGYGVVLEGTRGVAVDNYAIRSNSGIAMFGTDAQVNAQLGRMLGFDMIVLQWGLNAMSADATDYKAYGAQLRRVVNYMKSCFPRSAIVIMGVGDRAVQREGEMITQPGVLAMLREQRAAAEACGVAFWNTFAAMGGQGSMSAFVERGWAAKDYTHLSYGGGRYIAGQFVQSLLGARGAGGEAPAAGVPEPESVELDLSRATQAVPVEKALQVVEDTVTVVETQTDTVVEVQVVQQDTTTVKKSVWESLEAAVDSTRVDE
jgi:hypothetical protein